MRKSSLNHTYRLVWSQVCNAFVAVAEITKSHGKSCRAGRVAATVLGVAVAPWSLAQLAVAPSSGTTAITAAPNAVPVVNINNANSAGLSHNKYTSYNVGSNGLILNNRLSSAGNVQTQLAGSIQANPNLTNAASVILNEVVSTNRSVLAGFTEVAGTKANVVVANPYGITCNGCGFINTDRVTLSTGTPNIAGDGSLAGFMVNRGDVLINGNGLNATAQNILDIVTRSFTLDGQLNAKTLQLVLGNSTYDYINRTSTTNAASGTAPSYSFDSTALGGMYAERISIKATEAGVGVRMLANAAATADDFAIDAAGKIEIGKAISAARDLALVTSHNTADAIALSSAEVTAGRNLALTASSGGATLAGGRLVASNNLNGTLGSLSDTSTLNAGITDNNTRYATAALNLTVTGAAAINGTTWGSAGSFTGNVGSLGVGATGGDTLYAGTTLDLTATTGNLSLGKAGVQSAGNLTLSAVSGSISTVAATSQGVRSTGGNISATAGTGFSNAGAVSADLGSVTLRTSGTVNNTGSLYGKTVVDIADQSNASTENITNSGTLVVDGTLIVKGASVTNSGGIQGTGGTTFNATSLNNSGTFIASNNSAQSGLFTLGSLNNSGTLQSAKDLTLNLASSLSNTGKLLATRDLLVSAGTNAVAISNTSPGYIEAGNALSISGANATFNTQSGTVHGNTVGLMLGTLNNSGLVQSETTSAYNLGGALTNSGTMLAKTTMTSSSASLTNSGIVQANGSATIAATNALTNTGTIILTTSTTGTATINAGTLSNSGSGANIQSAHNLTLNISGATLTNAADILADDHLTIASTGSGLTITNNSGGFIQAGSASSDVLTLGSGVTIDNKAGGYLIGGALAVSVPGITNAGTILGGATEDTITVSGTLSNSGVISLGGNTTADTVTVGTLTNSGTGSAIQSTNHLKVSASTGASNAGTLLAAKNLTFTDTSTNGITFDNSGYLQAGASAGDTLTLTSTNLGGKATTFNNKAAGVIYGNTLALSAKDLSNDGWIQGISGSTLNVTGALTNTYTAANTGTIILTTSTTGTATINAGTLSNSGSGANIQSAHNLTLNISGATLTNAADIIADDNLTITSTGSGLTLTNNSGGFIQSGSASSDILTLGSGVTIDNKAGGYLIGGALAVSVPGITNAGTILGGATDDTITVSGTLSNSGVISLGGNTTADTVTVGTLTNSGTGSAIQSTNHLKVSASTAASNAGTLLAAKNLTFTDTSTNGFTFDNSGYLQAGASAGDTLTLTSTNLGGKATTFNNKAAGVIYGDTLALSAKALTNADWIQGLTGTTVNVTNALTNTGTIILTTSATGTATINAGTVSNTAGGNIQSAHDLALNLSGATLTNSADIIAADNLTLTATGGALTLTNNSGGFIQAGNTAGDKLSIGASGAAVTIDNKSGGYLIGDTLAITVPGLSNAGYLVGGAGNSTVTVTGTSANALANSGTMVADYLTVSAKSNTTNSGNMLANKNLTFTSAGSGLLLTNSGFMQAGSSSGNTLTLGGTALALTNTGTGKIYGDTLSVTSTTMDNQTSGKIVSYGTAAYYIATGLTNSGTMYSGSTLYISGTDTAYDIILNGLMQSDRYLNIRRTNSSNTNTLNFTVNGTGIIKASHMRLAASSMTFANPSAPTTMVDIGNTGIWYLDSLTMQGSNVRLLGASNGITNTNPITDDSGFNNSPNSFDIGATTPVTINGAIVSYADLGVGSSGLLTISPNSTLYAARTARIGNTGGTLNQGAIISAGTSALPNMPGTSLYGNFTNADTGTIQSNNRLWFSGGDFLNNGSLSALEHIYFSMDTGHTFTNRSLTTDPAKMAKIVAGGQLAIASVWYMNGYGLGGANGGYLNASNLGGLLSAGTDIVLEGCTGLSACGGSTSTFTNDGNGTAGAVTGAGVRWGTSGSLITNRTNVTNINSAASSAGGNSTAGTAGSRTETNPTGGSSSGATGSGTSNTTGSGATALSNGTSGASASGSASGATALSNGTSGASASGSASGATALSNGTSGASVSGSASAASPIVSTTNASGAAAITINGLSVTLPSNPNGVFLTNPNPTAQYLIESNPLFLNYNYTVSSNVLIDELGLSKTTDTLLRRLGDASYENYLISNQLVNLTHRSMLNGYNDQNTMVYSMFMSAAVESKSLGLTFGKALSSEQQANLKQDMVWMVETEVSGIRVLAPVVYLSAETKASIQSGGMTGGNFVMNGGSLNNQGGSIAVTNAQINATGDINNQGGSISGSNLALNSTQGGLNNTDGRIVARDTLIADVSKDIQNIRGNMAGNNIGLFSSDGGLNNQTGTIAASGIAIVDVKRDINNAGGRVTGTDVSLTSREGAINNLGGTVRGTNSLALSSAADIKTAGGSLQTRSLALESTQGKVDLSGVNTNASKSDPDRLKSLAVTSKSDIVNKNNTISVDNLSLRSTGGSIVNDRGTIEGTESLSLRARQDINNVGGTIRGGDVSLKTDLGSINNTSLVGPTGVRNNTGITDKASITATGNLRMDSAKDINITGADVSAKGSAVLRAGGDVNLNTVVLNESESSKERKGRTATTVEQQRTINVGSNLKAGENLVIDSGNNINIIGSNVSADKTAVLKAAGNVTVDTAVNTTDTTVKSKTSSIFRSSSSTTTTNERTNVGSNIKTGEDLIVVSGGNTTIAGSNVETGGDLFAKTGGSLNIIAREDTVTTKSEKKVSGLGVGNALWGSQKTVTDKFVGTNAGSDVKVGGNLIALSDRDVTIQGSNIAVKGSGVVDAKGNINVLDGFNESRTTTRTETVTVFGVGSSNTAKAGASSELKKSGTSVKADVTASASAENKSSLNFFQKQVTETKSESKDSVASNLSFGGNAALSAGNTLTIKGSNLDAVGDVFIQATDVKILAGQNTSSETTKTKTDSFGIFVDNKANAGAKAGVTGKAQSAGINVGASAEAQASTTVTLGGRTSTQEDAETSLTNVGSKITSGGNLIVLAKNDATFQAAQLESAGDMVIKATNINNLAAQDITTKTSKSDTVTSGLFVGASGKVSAEVGAKGGLNAMGVVAEVQVNARADEGVGVRVGYEGERSASGSVTQQTSSFKAGGDLVRIASDTIRDQGTQLEAGGDIKQSARRLLEEQVSDSSFSRTTKNENEFRVGLFATQEVEAGAHAQGGLVSHVKAPANNQSQGKDGPAKGREATTGAEIKLDGGVRVTNDYRGSEEKSAETVAVTSSYKAGGSIISITTEDTRLIGTKMAAGKDIVIGAQTLDFQAAQDTSSESGTTRATSTRVDVNLLGKKKEVNIFQDIRVKEENETSTTARVGSLDAGGSVTIVTKDDARFVGTEITAKNNVDITSLTGSVNFEAAKSTTKTSTTTGTGGFDITIAPKGKPEVEANAGASISDGTKDKTTAVKITSGQGDVNVTASKDINLEGTKIKAGGNASLDAGGTVRMLEALDTERATGGGFTAQVAIGEKATSAGGGFAVQDLDRQQGSVVTIESGGKTTIKGTNVVSQDAKLKGATTEISGTLTTLKRTDVNTDVDVEFGAEVVRKEPKKPTKPNKNNNKNNPTTNPTTAPNTTTPTTTAPGTNSTTPVRPPPPSNPPPLPNTTAPSTTTPGTNSTTPVRPPPPSNPPPLPNTTTPSTTTPGTNSTTPVRPPPPSNPPPLPNTTAPTTTTPGTNSTTPVRPPPPSNPPPLPPNTTGTNTTGTTTPPPSRLQVLDSKIEKINENGLTGNYNVVSNTSQVGDDKETKIKDFVTKPGDSSGSGTAEATVTVVQAPVAAPVITPIQIRSVVSMPPVPQGAQVQTQTKDGQPLPSWVKFDPVTGVLSGTPPPDFKGSLDVVIKVLQAGGGVQEVTTTLGGGN